MKYLLIFITSFSAIIFLNSCEEDEALESVQINSVLINQLPEENDGEPWDEDGSNPDFYIVVKNGDQTLATSEIMRDTLPSSELTFVSEFPVTASQIREGVYIDIREDDNAEGEGDGSEFIGSVSFVPEFHSDKESIVLTKEPEEIGLIVFTTWNYK